MTNHLTWETLNDLVDGVLGSAPAQSAESHARECRTCATALAELRATVEGAQTLPGSIDPPDELWADVRATIEAGKVAHLPAGTRRAPPRGWLVTPGKLAAAAVVLMAATASLTGIVMRSPAASSIVASGTDPIAVSVSWQTSEKAFQASVLELREQLDVLHDHLAPETVVKVERALATIDLAIAEAREALLHDPANAALSEMLASNYRQKIELLRRVTQLASS